MGIPVIIMAYYDRRTQLLKTLETIRKSAVDNYRIVITDDASPEPLTVDDDRVHIIRIEPQQKKWLNPEPAYNLALLYAIRNLDPGIIILQNPECMHSGDVLKYAVEHTGDDNYLSFGCYSIDKETTRRGWDGTTLNTRVMTEMGNGWYNHTKYRPEVFDFCSAISAKSIIRINGYDERLSDGRAYGDDYLIYRIRLSGLKVFIIDSPFVVHQWHECSDPEGWKALKNENKLLFERLKQNKDIRAVHKYTDDL